MKLRIKTTYTVSLLIEIVDGLSAELVFCVSPAQCRS